MKPQILESLPAGRQVRIKICCIQSVEEGLLALSEGADVLGLVGAMPSGPGPIPDEQISGIVRGLPASTETFLLTSETMATGIIAHYQRTGTTAIQLVDTIEQGAHARIRTALPEVQLVQVIHVTGPESLDEALLLAPHVDKLLLDSGNPHAAVKELGGTGRTHNWAISRQIVEQTDVPVFLAGGLRADNVREAIEQVQPYGVDLCSGVRTNGRLDPTKLANFIHAVRG